MKKQVTFAESQMIHGLHLDEALPRSTGMNESKMAFKDAGENFNSGFKIDRPPSAECEPQLQQVTTIQIPKPMTAAPFLKHAALTPAQKEYLYTIAASYSAMHVRNLITQHYMNVLHRSIPAGYSPERDDLVVSSVISLGADESEKHSSEVPSGAKHKEKINASARNPGKSSLPKIPNTKARLSNTSALTQNKIKKRTTTSPTLRRKSPRRVRIRLLEENEEEEEEGLDDPMSESLSSLSVREWDDDTFSDL